MNPKQIATLLMKAAELMALAEAPDLPELDRIQLLQTADLILDECERAGFAVTGLRPGTGIAKLH